MTTALDGRVVAVTGAGRGLGREYALRLAAEGAHVVVNDVGAHDGRRSADAVVEEIVAAGGTATPDVGDVSDWAGARGLIEAAVRSHGSLDALVNNAGIHREGVLDGLDEDDWDLVLRVNLRGHVAPLKAAADYWRSEAAAGRPRRASIVNTTSIAGLGSFGGPVPYAAAKAGVAQLTINAAWQLAPHGIRVNAVAPTARTPMIADVRLRPDHAGIAGEQAATTFGELLAGRAGRFDRFHPRNVAPLVAYLAGESSAETGRVFEVYGGRIGLFQPWHVVAAVENDGPWATEDLAERMAELDVPLEPTPSFLADPE